MPWPTSRPTWTSIRTCSAASPRISRRAPRLSARSASRASRGGDSTKTRQEEYRGGWMENGKNGPKPLCHRHRTFSTRRKRAEIPETSAGLILARRQFVQDALALAVVEHHPAADLLDGALAAQAKAAALGIDHADPDAGRHHASRLRRRGHGGQDF